jgi:hypothetical protein
MYQYPDWRDEPRRISLYSITLLLIFVGAVAATLYVGLSLKPWADDPPAAEMDARTWADRGLTPQPPDQVTAPE